MVSHEGYEASVKRASLDAVLRSPEFSQAGRLSQLLRFLGEQALDPAAIPLKERTIGIEVFGRALDYDPKIDSVVRTEVRRLRLKLAEYYAGTGARDPVRLQLPKGSYRVEYLDAGLPEKSTPEGDPGPAETPNAPPAAVDAPSVSPPPLGVPGRSWKAGRQLVIGSVLAAFAGAAWMWVERQPKTGPATMGPRQLTESVGQAIHPSLSADGSLLAYSYASGADSGIYLRQLDTDQPAWRLSGTRARDFDPALSPSGAQVAFLREDAPARFSLLVQPVNETTQRVWATLDRRDRITWSADEKFLIVSARTTDAGPPVLVRLDAAGSRTVLTTPPPGALYDGSPTLSPDGRTLAFSRAFHDSSSEIYVAAVGPDLLIQGTPRALTAERRRITGFCFAPDGESILASLQRAGSLRGLWRISLGTPSSWERLAEAGIQASYPAVAPRSGRVVYMTSTDDINLYRADPSRPDPGSSITPLAHSIVLDGSPALSPDGQWVAFRSARSGFSEVWTARIDGTETRRLTNAAGPVTGSPRWSPDGRRVAFDTRLDGHADIFVVDVASLEQRRITALPGDQVVPSWSRDGLSIYFSSNELGENQIWKTAADGRGSPQQITSKGGFRATESSDGQWLYYTKREPQSGLWRMPLNGGTERRVRDLPPALWGSWALSDSGLYWIDPKLNRIFFQGPGRPNPKTVLGLTTAAIQWDGALDVTRDDRTLVFAQLDRAIADLFQIEVKW